MTGVRLRGLAHELPAERLTDGDLSALLDLDEGEVAAHSRGRSRHGAADGQGPADLAARAATRTLSDTTLGSEDVDLIVFATNTPDFTFPGSACLLQHHLDAATVGCLDVRAQCAGFLAAFEIARRFVISGAYHRVLLASADVPTHVNRYDGVDPQLACLTGDAAAVVVVEAGTGEGEVLACQVEVDGSRHREFWCEFPASRHLVNGGVERGERVTREAFDSGRFYPQVDLEALAATAADKAPAVFERALEEAGLGEVDALIVAHLDPATEDLLSQRLSARTARVVEADCVYTLGTSLPLRLSRALSSGRVESGETVGLVTAGAGASWGAAIVRV